jgi:hypothetical protein
MAAKVQIDDAGALTVPYFVDAESRSSQRASRRWEPGNAIVPYRRLGA